MITSLTKVDEINETEAFEVLGINLEEKDIYINAISYFEELMEKYEKVSKEEV